MWFCGESMGVPLRTRSSFGCLGNGLWINGWILHLWFHRYVDYEIVLGYGDRW
jgi:hypothetical protein